MSAPPTAPAADAPAPTSDGWQSRIGVILAVAGSAVGLGNFLRFPGQAAQNGGGAFLLPYFVSLLILGIPLAWAEWTIGRYAGQRGFTSAPGIFAVLCRDLRARYLGVLGLLIPLVIYMYYVVIEAWCLAYAWHYLNGTAELVGKDADPGKFLGKLIGAGSDGALFEPSGQTLMVIVAITFILNFVLIYRGVGKGIELFCKAAIPLMVFLAIVVLIRVLTLGTPDPAKPDQSVLGGLGFMWNPKPEALWSPQTWLAAAGQIFFSLSVGFGVVINYSSYLSKKDDVALSGLTACSMNEFFEVCLGGLITIPAAFIFLGAATGSSSGFTLGFVALPNVFNTMWGGQFFGFAWFFMLFTAAMTSSISMLQPVIAFLEEGFDLPRPASAATLGLIGALGASFVLYFSANTVALDTLDFWVGTLTIFVLALVQAVIYGWVFGIERGHRELHLGSHIRVPYAVQWILKYVVPVYMGVIFVTFCLDNVPTKFVPVELSALDLPDDFEMRPFAEKLDAIATGHAASRVTAVVPDNGGEAEPHTLDFAAEIREGHVARPTLAFEVAPDGAVTAYERRPGKYEAVADSTVAKLSILVIGLVLGFLTVMTHLAGRRWETSGRWQTALDAPIDTPED